MPRPFISPGLIEVRFRAFNLQLPPLAATPLGSVRSPSSTPSRSDGFLFRAASDSRTDLLEQQRMHALYKPFINSMTFAVNSGFDLWFASARLVDVEIQAGMAFGGRLDGPNLYGLIFYAAPEPGYLAPVGRAIADGLAEAWRGFQASIQVRGLPWYLGATEDNATPNVPTLLRVLGDPSFLSEAYLKMCMEGALRERVLFSNDLISSFAGELDHAFDLWLGIQYVQGLVARGQCQRTGSSNMPMPGTFAGTAEGPLL